MGKKLPYTPNGIIKNALRQVWLRSRERAAAMKREGYCCERCHVKQSVAKGKEQKMQVHHKNGIDWDGLAELVRDRLLPDPKDLEVICPDCHDKEHAERGKRGN